MDPEGGRPGFADGCDAVVEEGARALARACSRTMYGHGEDGGHFCMAYTARSGSTIPVTVAKIQ